MADEKTQIPLDELSDEEIAAKYGESLLNKIAPGGTSLDQLSDEELLAKYGSATTSLPEPTGELGDLGLQTFSEANPLTSLAAALAPQVGMAAFSGGASPALMTLNPYLAGVVGEEMPRALNQIAAAAPDALTKPIGGPFKEPNPMTPESVAWSAGAPAVSQLGGDLLRGVQNWWRGSKTEAVKKVGALINSKGEQKEVEEAFREGLVNKSIFKNKRGKLLRSDTDAVFDLNNQISKKIGGPIDEYGKPTDFLNAGKAELYPKVVSAAGALDRVRGTQTTIGELEEFYKGVAQKAKLQVGASLPEGATAISRAEDRLLAFKQAMRDPESPFFNSRYAELSERLEQAIREENLEAVAGLKPIIAETEIPFTTMVKHKQDLGGQISLRGWKQEIPEEANNTIIDKAIVLGLKEALDEKAKTAGTQAGLDFLKLNHEYHLYSTLQDLIKRLPQAAHTEQAKMGLLGRGWESLRVGSGGPRFVAGAPLGDSSLVGALGGQLNRATGGPLSPVPSMVGIAGGDFITRLADASIEEAEAFSREIPQSAYLTWETSGVPTVPKLLPRTVEAVKAYPQVIEDALPDPALKQKFHYLVKEGSKADLGSFLATELPQNPALQGAFEPDPMGNASFNSYLPEEAKGVYYKKNVDKALNGEIDWVQAYRRGRTLTNKSQANW